MWRHVRRHLCVEIHRTTVWRAGEMAETFPRSGATSLRLASCQLSWCQWWTFSQLASTPPRRRVQASEAVPLAPSPVLSLPRTAAV